MTLPPGETDPFSAPSPAPAAPPSPRRRVAFVINSLGQGGAERVMDNILHAARASAWECHLILLDREDERRTPPDHVRIHRLDYRFGLLASIRQLRPVLQAIKPDLVVSFLVRENVASVIAARSVAAPCIVSERVPDRCRQPDCPARADQAGGRTGVTSHAPWRHLLPPAARATALSRRSPRPGADTTAVAGQAATSHRERSRVAASWRPSR